MSLFINLTGDARKDKNILANIKRAQGDVAYAELHADALKLGGVMFSLFALHGERLDKREWDKLEETEQLRWGALAQKCLVALNDAAGPCPIHDHDDGSINIRIPGWAVDAVKAAFPMVIASLAGGSVVSAPAPSKKPEFVDLPFPFNTGFTPTSGPFGGPFPGNVNVNDVIDEEIRKVAKEEASE